MYLGEDKDIRPTCRRRHVSHRLNGSSSPVLTATSLSYGEPKNSTYEQKKITHKRWYYSAAHWHTVSV